MACFLVKNVLLIGVYSCFGLGLACIKAISIKISPRFTDEINDKLGENKDTFHQLYAKLDNVHRQFPESITTETPSYQGGKGFFAFIGKVIDLNAPSLSEKLLDKSLAIFIVNPIIAQEDFKTQLEQDETIDEAFSQNEAYIVSSLFRAS